MNKDVLQAVRVKPKHCISVGANIQELTKDEVLKEDWIYNRIIFH